MSGPLGVMAVLLLETAVGGAVVLWANGVWGAVRRGFFVLTGVTLALCAAGAWAITRAAVEGVYLGAAPDDRALPALAGFTGLLVVWQVLLLARLDAASRVVGILAAVAGLVALGLFAALSERAVGVALAELVLGALFLGSTLHGLLLGHWYLVERRLTNAYMVRSAWWYGAGVVAAVLAVALSARNPLPDVGSTFSPFLAVPGFTVLLAGGLVAICAIIAGFVWKLAQEGGRSIQAATGYFYLAVIMAFAAELSTKLRFF
jgi:hypothetical protein